MLYSILNYFFTTRNFLSPRSNRLPLLRSCCLVFLFCARQKVDPALVLFRIVVVSVHLWRWEVHACVFVVAFVVIAAVVTLAFVVTAVATVTDKIKILLRVHF